jgi:hypothetical protein
VVNLGDVENGGDAVVELGQSAEDFADVDVLRTIDERVSVVRSFGAIWSVD